MTVLEWLAAFPYLPPGTHGKARPSKSDLRRWLENASIQINGRGDWGFRDEMEFPVTQLIFFPKGRRATLWDKLWKSSPGLESAAEEVARLYEVHRRESPWGFLDEWWASLFDSPRGTRDTVETT